jgi:hypothetical protein
MFNGYGKSCERKDICPFICVVQGIGTIWGHGDFVGFMPITSFAPMPYSSGFDFQFLPHFIFGLLYSFRE